MPLVECPTCHYRSPVRTANLTTYTQCLRCTSRFIPTPAVPRRPGRALVAAAGAIAVSLVTIAWVVFRMS